MIIPVFWAYTAWLLTRLISGTKQHWQYYYYVIIFLHYNIVFVTFHIQIFIYFCTIFINLSSIISLFM